MMRLSPTNLNPWPQLVLPNHYQSGDLEADTMPGLVGCESRSPVIWETYPYHDFASRVQSRSDFSYVTEMLSFSPQNGIRLHIPEVRKGKEIAWDGGEGGQWGNIAQTTKTLAGLMRSGSRGRREVVGKTPRQSVLAIIDGGEDGFENWVSACFENPRPAPAPPSAGALPLASRPQPWASDLPPRTRVHPPRESRISMEGTRAVDQSRRSSALTSFIAVCQTTVAEHPSPSSPPSYLFEPIRAPRVNSSPPTLPKQVLGGGTIPLPTVSATCPLVPEQTGRRQTHSRQNSADSSMDRVYVQIQDCITATEKLGETMVSCSYIDHDSVEKVCDGLSRALRGMQKTIDEGIQNVELNTPEKIAWNDKQQALEMSVQKNVRKYYQAAIHTARKPPRINHLDDRMDKLSAYVRKFRDLNIRILASYDKLRILELQSQLNTAYASARRNKSAEMIHEREGNGRWRVAIEDLKQDIQVLRGQRSARLMTLKDIKDTALPPVPVTL